MVITLLVGAAADKQSLSVDAVFRPFEMELVLISFGRARSDIISRLNLRCSFALTTFPKYFSYRRPRQR
jgi:hypothetical protein